MSVSINLFAILLLLKSYPGPETGVAGLILLLLDNRNFGA